MADEISINVRMKVSNGNSQFDFAPGTLILDQTAVGGPTPGMVSIGTSEETIAFAELGTEGWFVMRNLDATNYVQWGFSTGVYGGRMEAGETAGPFRLEPSTTLYLIANTAACKVVAYALED